MKKDLIKILSSNISLDYNDKKKSFDININELAELIEEYFINGGVDKIVKPIKYNGIIKLADKRINIHYIDELIEDYKLSGHKLYSQIYRNAYCDGFMDCFEESLNITYPY